ncbi:hypothetical protein CFB41_36150 [Burkholderia sp. AU33803]|uniref:integrase core domain-containing protein n=1 Tax=Burkholderia contaminans TaxID=488447 RepID=UPI000B7AD631|nr:hypothetical protein CFB41_36150 [Burkholderia sp. AU33803]PRD87158.1 hypothetical protein C6P88_30070 [Burkholderia contaminans]
MPERGRRLHVRVFGHRSRYFATGLTSAASARAAHGDTRLARINHGQKQAGVRWQGLVHAPTKPVENAYVESFNGRFRDECLNEHWFVSMRHAKRLIQEWRSRDESGENLNSQ